MENSVSEMDETGNGTTVTDVAKMDFQSDGVKSETDTVDSTVKQEIDNAEGPFSEHQSDSNDRPESETIEEPPIKGIVEYYCWNFSFFLQKRQK